MHYTAPIIFAYSCLLKSVIICPIKLNIYSSLEDIAGIKKRLIAIYNKFRYYYCQRS